MPRKLKEPTLSRVIVLGVLSELAIACLIILGVTWLVEHWPLW